MDFCLFWVLKYFSILFQKHCMRTQRTAFTGLVYETQADFVCIKTFWECFFNIYKLLQFSKLFVMNVLCKQSHSILLVFHHHATSINTFKSPADCVKPGMYKHRRSSVSIVSNWWEYFIVHAAERNVQILCQYDIICAFPLGKEIIRADARRIKR